MTGISLYTSLYHYITKHLLLQIIQQKQEHMTSSHPRIPPSKLQKNMSDFHCSAIVAWLSMPCSNLKERGSKPWNVGLGIGNPNLYTFIWNTVTSGVGCNLQSPQMRQGKLFGPGKSGGKLVFVFAMFFSSMDRMTWIVVFFWRKI